MRTEEPVYPASAKPLIGERTLTALLTISMAVSMLQLFLVGTLSPRLMADAGISPTVLGLTATFGFGAASLFSLGAGTWVDRFGARRCLIALFVLTAVALALIGSSAGAVTLLIAVTLGGLPQSLANPATNKIILAQVEPARRGAVTGWKQSGVQVGTIAAGLPLAALAAWTGWRGAVWTAAGISLLIAVWAWRALPYAPRVDPAAPSQAQGAKTPGVAVLAAFSLMLGAGISSVNTYLTLFGTQRLGLGPVVAAWLVAVLGTAGFAGRIGWSSAAGRRERAESLLIPLGIAACTAGLLLASSAWFTPLAWVGAAGIGAFGVAANAVTMVAVVRHAHPSRAGRDSGRISSGFFAGFAVGPPLFGLLVESVGYEWGWVLVAAEFAAAAAVAAFGLSRLTRPKPA
ncbi:Predicted arabinose efflux permease, MFS family [Sinosporangium album]|uniref:Predicted arabinose efflux permease, MFS family n=1 Tax=Sinosporangium album TaxID=504805 RepID=A0A1G7SXI7_9ACTN|nr:MFS transporter [Sinosporangium album]SDG27582.1 Predicted arabinose efflux permease, MFS family [Sinosporangium album]